MTTRTEHDSLGSKEIPASAYYGIQTARAVENFDITGVTNGTFPHLVRALAYIKKAAALANVELGILPSPV
ncbi:MAG: aspartate ammonia-lyase, partial [Deltaproteobacteria bacterium]|nr:aspartate ammonia-lyase [Deltaproteobacteria bacterium]